MFSCGYDSMHSVSAWGQNSNDNYDSEVGDLSHDEEQTRNFQAHWKSNFPWLEYDIVVIISIYINELSYQLTPYTQ